MQESVERTRTAHGAAGVDPLLVAAPHWLWRAFVIVLPVAALIAAAVSIARAERELFWTSLAVAGFGAVVAPGVLLRRVTVFPDRMEQRRVFSTRRIRFDEVTRVRLGPGKAMGTTPTMGVKFNGAGTQIGLGLVQNSADVYELVAPLVVPQLASRLNREIDETGAVQFGKLSAQPDGLHTPRGLLPWHLVGSFAFGPSGARILPTNHPELTVTVPNTTQNLPALQWIVEWRKGDFFQHVRERAMERGITEEQLLQALEQRLPSGDTFGMPEHDVEFGRHLCTLPPVRWLGLGPRRGKYGLYETGMVAGRKRIAIRDCESVAYKVVSQYYEGAYVATFRTLTLRSVSRRKISFTSARGEAETFCDAVLARFLPGLVQHHLQRIAQGETIAYGKVKLSRDTLTIGRKVLSIAELRGVNDHQGSLHFWTDLNAKPVGSIDLGTPNALVLHRILYQLIYSPP